MAKQLSKKSPTGPTERTPRPEYLIALATYLGVRWGPIQFLMEIRNHLKVQLLKKKYQLLKICKLLLMVNSDNCWFGAFGGLHS